MNAAGEAQPNLASTPYFSDYQVVDGVVDFPADLQDNVDYEFFLRQNCSLGKGCWLGPFSFSTFEYCGDEPDSIRFIPRPITTDIVLPNYTDDGNYWVLDFGTAPYDRPDLGATGNVSYSTLNSNDPDHVTFTIYDLQPNTDYQVYIKRNCSFGINNQTNYWQPWFGPFNFSTNKDCFVEVEELYCGQCYADGPRYGYDFFDEYASCEGSGVPSRGERIFRIQEPNDGQLVIDRGQSATTGGNTIIYHFFLKSASEVCDENGWEELGCWRPGTGDDDLTIDVQADSIYYLMIDYKTQSSFEERLRHRFYVSGPDCVNTCPAVTGLSANLISAQSILATWDPIPGAIGYDVALIPSNLVADLVMECKKTTFYSQADIHPDTSFLLEVLDPSLEYNIVIRAHCAPGNWGPLQSLTVQTTPTNQSDFSNSGTLQYCSPFYQREDLAGTSYYSYDALELTVDEEAYYTLSQSSTIGTYLGLYEDQFDPANPTQGLLTEASSDIDSPTSAELLWLLETNKKYVVVSTRANQNEPGNQIDLRISGLGVASSSGYRHLGQRTGPSGRIPATNGTFYASTQICVDSSGWRHYYRTDGGNQNFDEDLLLFSIEDYPEVYNGPLEDTVALLGETGTSLIPNTPENYVLNPSGWITMNRFWYLRIQEEQQPSEALNIRFYYTEEDLEALRQSIPGGAGLEQKDLYFYKINDEGLNYDSNPAEGHLNIPAADNCAADGFWEYANGALADTTHWRLGEYGGQYFAEMTVHKFSGGGGGVGSPFDFSTSAGAISNDANAIWQLYPNPFYDRLEIRGKQVAYPIEKIQVLNVEGKRLIEQHFSPAPLQYQLELGELPSGLYFVKISSAKETAVFRVLKE